MRVCRLQAAGAGGDQYLLYGSAKQRRATRCVRVGKATLLSLRQSSNTICERGSPRSSRLGGMSASGGSDAADLSPRNLFPFFIFLPSLVFCSVPLLLRPPRMDGGELMAFLLLSLLNSFSGVQLVPSALWGCGVDGGGGGGWARGATERTTSHRGVSQCPARRRGAGQSRRRR